MKPMILSPRSVRETICAEITTWIVEGTPYAVHCSVNLFGLDPVWTATIRLPNGNEKIVGRHRRKMAALRSVRRHARQVRLAEQHRKRTRSVSREKLAETSIKRKK